MDEQQIQLTLERIAHEIIERYHQELEEAIFIGIRTRGIYIAQRLQKRISELTGKKFLSGVLDITLYRDDLTQIGPAPLVRSTELPFGQFPSGVSVFLFDDVIFTGRTIRAALDELMDFGRPRAVRCIALIDRNHRELPIQPDIVGKFVLTQLDEIVHVFLKEVDGKDEVLVTPKIKESSQGGEG